MRTAQVRRRQADLAVVAGTALWLAACSAIAPMQKPDDDRLFRVARPAGAGQPPCIAHPSRPDECRPLAQDLDAFAGDLGHALWEMDERRRELVGYVVDRGNLASAYNALLWPIGAFLINKKIADPTWSARDAIAVAAASAGLMNAGIADRDKLYLRSAHEMLCLMVGAQADLYLHADGASGDGRHPRLDRPLATGLAWRIQNFDKERVSLLIQLGPTPGRSATPPRYEQDRLRAEALGRRGGGSTPSSGGKAIEQIEQVTATMAAAARKDLAKLQAAQRRVERAGTELRLRRSRIEAAQVQGLSERVELKNPFDVARELTEVITTQRAAEQRFQSQLASAHSGAAAGIDADTWLPTPERLKGVKARAPKNGARSQEAIDVVGAFWTGQVADLRMARDAARRWLAQDEARRRAASATASGIGCDGGSLAAFADSLLKSTAPAASPAASAAQTPSVELLQ